MDIQFNKDTVEYLSDCVKAIENSMMNNGYLYIINSAPGIGKSTLLQNLHMGLPEGFASLDGDDVGRVIPYQNNLTWLNLIQDNIADCCINFRKSGFNRCVISFVFPSEERLEHLRDLLTGKGFHVTHMLLECSEDEIERRIMAMLCKDKLKDRVIYGIPFDKDKIYYKYIRPQLQTQRVQILRDLLDVL